MTNNSPALLDRTDVSDETERWLARIGRLVPLIREHRQHNESRRFMSPEVFEALRAAGVHRMLISREFGGAQVELATGSAVVQELARHDPSLGWQMGVQAAIGRLSDYLPEPTARKMFKDHAGLVVGSVNPTGRAEPVDGGYTLSGTWAFASGSAHADWLVCAAVVTENGRPRITGGGPGIRMLFVPKDECRMLDTWYTLGLRGTGSEHYELDETFVPDEFVVDQADMFRPPDERPSRGYAISYYDFGLFGSASTALGIARGALAEFKTLATRKTATAATSALAEGHVVQERVARAEMLVRGARLMLADAAWHAARHGTAGDPLSALVRLAAATVAENTAAAVDIAFELAGSSSLYESSMLEHYFRDIHTAVKHITLSHTNVEMVGRYLLGGELSMRR
ncbi:acyl-CoA dehydrogenase family protein [Nocardia aurantia]|uniref:Flavin-dependent monooxygenase, oxygenase subunit HsaA n=1 Tax=Nocardia aurantia TaxID=2585199 RepID=A0A7K0DP08_9NOCA|nr:acyl-CoA dehydrogenase family protein [Nocardia aurantia]MQY27473.1 Flavin-dependent monooxygenase, oxygenase subunit HsaA [Nocardia aurantia]